MQSDQYQVENGFYIKNRRETLYPEKTLEASIMKVWLLKENSADGMHCVC